MNLASLKTGCQLNGMVQLKRFSKVKNCDCTWLCAYTNIRWWMSGVEQIAFEIYFCGFTCQVNTVCWPLQCIAFCIMYIYIQVLLYAFTYLSITHLRYRSDFSSRVPLSICLQKAVSRHLSSFVGLKVMSRSIKSQRRRAPGWVFSDFPAYGWTKNHVRWKLHLTRLWIDFI